MQRELAASVDRSMLSSKAFYLFYFAALACLVPFLTLYYQRIGLSGRQIGTLSAIAPLVSIFSAPMWGALSDATQQHKRVLLAMISSMFVIVLALSRTTTYLLLIPIIAIYAFFGSPIISLVDNSVIESLGKRKDEYGKQRLWGSVGWGLAAPIIGWVIEQNGQGWAFYGYFILSLGTLIVASRLPVVHSKTSQQFGQDLRLMLTNRRWILFLMTIFIGGMSLTFVLNFAFLYLDSLGASETLMGLFLTVTTLGEMPLWFFADRLLNRWGSRGLLMISLAACAVQAFTFSFVQIPWLALPIQLIQGLAFSAMWTAGVSYAAQIAPEGTKATAQGVLAAVTMGLRSAVGAFVGGILYDGLGAVPMFRVGGVCALIGLLLFVIGGRETRRT
ncbi:MAG: MFS transporter [Chloroflexi bacterium]|nr:MFS transporter [Chloroflexota bacterium]